jgi:hypothetical protein
MTSNASDLYAEIKILSDSLEPLSAANKAAIFGACGRAINPLVKEVERTSGRRWSSPDLDLALSIVEKFATGVIEQADHAKLRERLMASAPHGHALQHPWGTYVQDTLICADAGLAAASTDTHVKSIWIQYALEPQMVWMQIRDVDVIRSRGDEYWANLVVADPAMAEALKFLRDSIDEVSQNEFVTELQYRRMVDGAAILRPSGL